MLRDFGGAKAGTASPEPFVSFWAGLGRFGHYVQVQRLSRDVWSGRGGELEVAALPQTLDQGRQ